MKKYYLASLAAATVIFSACGGGSSSATTTTTLSSPTTIKVERGPILGAIVTDAAGSIAIEDGNGSYTFKGVPVYPVLVTGGVIDVDRDGNISIGDVANDLNLSTTGGSVVTLATTLATNPKTKATLDKIASTLNLTTTDILSKTPSDSKEIEAISNILYKYIKDNNISNLLDTQDAKISNLSATTLEADIDTEYKRYVANEAHDSKEEEAKLMQTLSNEVNDLDEKEVEDELKRVETIHTIYEENKEDETELKNQLKIELGEDVDKLTQEAISIKNEFELEYGDLDYEESDDDARSAAHYQGDNCLKCHAITGATTARSFTISRDDDGEENEANEANENQFTSGATIFTKLNAPTITKQEGALPTTSYLANGYTLKLVLENSDIVYNYSAAKGTGNINAVFDTATLNGYTAQVIDTKGNVVNSSATNSHDASRLDCNSCHSSSGANGAPGRIVSFEYNIPPVVTTDSTPTTPVETTPTVTVPTTVTTPTETVATRSFANDVMPVLEAKCKSCHGSKGNFTITTASATYANINSFGGINTTTVESSRLLQKAIGNLGHGGGDALGGNTSTDYTTLKDWITQGALDN